jgi:hypothetical protein
MSATKGIIYYTGGGVPDKVATGVREQLLTIGLPIVSCTLEPLDFGKNIVIEGQKGYLTMFRQILAALEASTTEVVFFCEHDNLYHSSHFNFTPPAKDVFYYDHNWWKIGKGDLAVHWDADQVSGLCCYRETAIRFYQDRIASFDPNNFDRKFEPMSGLKSESWRAKYPSIDIRGRWNLTYNKWSLDHFRDKSTAKNFAQSTIDQIPGWDTEKLRVLL